MKIKTSVTFQFHADHGCAGLGWQRGFSLVELVAILVLLGIVGVVIMPRFLEEDAFSVAAAQDGLITTIRAAQQSSLGRDSVTFAINSDANNWIFLAKASGTDIRTFEVPLRDVTLETGSADTPPSSGDTCAAGTEFDTPIDAMDFELAFDRNGNLTEFTNDGNIEPVDASFNGVRICVNNTVELSVCISTAGYAYAGNCDE